LTCRLWELPLASCPSRHQDQFAVVVKIGTALRVIDENQTAFVKRFGPVLGAFVYLFDPTSLGPSISSSVPYATVCAVIAAKGSPGRMAWCATTERKNAGHKNEWAPFGQNTDHPID